jgi:hypothetical protein
MKLTMKREALEKINRLANEMTVGEAQPVPKAGSFSAVLAQFDGVNPSVETVWNWHTCSSMIFPSQTSSSPSG